MNEIRKQQLEQIANNDYLLDAKPTTPQSYDGTQPRTKCVDELDEAVRILGKHWLDEQYEKIRPKVEQAFVDFVLYGEAKILL